MQQRFEDLARNIKQSEFAKKAKSAAIYVDYKIVTLATAAVGSAQDMIQRRHQLRTTPNRAGAMFKAKVERLRNKISQKP